MASHNPGKLAELREFLAPFGVSVVSAGDLGLPEPVEDGDSFVANALIKAHASARGAKLPALADDSGLCVDALGGAPGIHSARWAGPGKDFGVAMARVEAELAATGAAAPERRGGHFVSVLALAWPDGHAETVEGRIDGTLVWPPRGTGGFGYDPMFLPTGESETFGEMAAARKNRLSHRARAFVRLVDACFR